MIETYAGEMPFDHPQEACGVFGVVAPGLDVARITYFGLYALQHRGQESAGIAAASGEAGSDLRIHTRMGLVATAFDEDILQSLIGTQAIGHTRYSTTGSSVARNAGPVLAQSDIGPIAVAHNGNLTNAAILRQRLEAEGEFFETSTDSEVLARVIACSPGRTIADRLRAAMDVFEGAYSLAVLTPTEMYAVRDPLGLRPLSLGRLGNGWVVASETCALATTGAAFVRDVSPGEIVRITATAGPESLVLVPGTRDALCVFELIYFARPDSMMGGDRIHLLRQRMGAELAREQPVDADIVVPLPDSAIPAGIGYASESGIPYAEALIKNRYIGRTFIQPDQHLREVGIALKFNPLPEVLEGQAGRADRRHDRARHDEPPDRPVAARCGRARSAYARPCAADPLALLHGRRFRLAQRTDRRAVGGECRRYRSADRCRFARLSVAGRLVPGNRPIPRWLLHGLPDG